MLSSIILGNSGRNRDHRRFFFGKRMSAASIERKISRAWRQMGWLKKMKKKNKNLKVSRIVVDERGRRGSIVTFRELRSPNKEQMQVKKSNTSRSNYFRCWSSKLSFLIVSRAGIFSSLKPETGDIENYLPEKADIENYCRKRADIENYLTWIKSICKPLPKTFCFKKRSRKIKCVFILICLSLLELIEEQVVNGSRSRRLLVVWEQRCWCSENE